MNSVGSMEIDDPSLIYKPQKLKGISGYSTFHTHTILYLVHVIISLAAFILAITCIGNRNPSNTSNEDIFFRLMEMENKSYDESISLKKQMSEIKIENTEIKDMGDKIHFDNIAIKKQINEIKLENNEIKENNNKFLEVNELLKTQINEIKTETKELKEIDN